MEVLNNLEDVELLTTYQKNDIIVSTCLFLIFFYKTIYKIILQQSSLFENNLYDFCIFNLLLISCYFLQLYNIFYINIFIINNLG